MRVGFRGSVAIGSLAVKPKFRIAPLAVPGVHPQMAVGLMGLGSAGFIGSSALPTHYDIIVNRICVKKGHPLVFLSFLWPPRVSCVKHPIDALPESGYNINR